MGDIIDQANDHQLIVDEARIQQIRASRSDRLQPTGQCLNCEDPVEPGALFCAGGECRTDYEKRQRMRGYAG